MAIPLKRGKLLLTVFLFIRLGQAQGESVAGIVILVFLLFRA
jgi:hypothetical protein